MPTSGPLHPRRADGSEIDATFEVSVVPVFDIVYHHKAGGRDSARSVNADYHEGLEALLDKLAAGRVTILGISVDSTVARELAPADRELQLPFPIALEPGMNVHPLRLDITRAQKPIARRPDAKPDGGNDQKRIRITVTSGGPTLTYERLIELLSEVTDSAARARLAPDGSDAPGEADAPRRTSTPDGATKHELDKWVVEALRELGGSASLVDICRVIWRDHQAGLKASGDLLYTWQYDARWSAHRLRITARLKPAHESPRGVWELA
jgi:hypothetical protein